MSWRSRQRTNLIAFVCCFVFIALFYGDVLFPRPRHDPKLPVANSKPGTDDVELVVASMKKENVTWLNDYLLDWKKNIYVVDDPNARLTVPVNKGREAMVFLTCVVPHDTNIRMSQGRRCRNFPIY